MIKILVRVLITAAALIAIAHVIPGISVDSFTTAVIAALIWGLFGLTIRPVLTLLTLPITLITFGLFAFVVNALLFGLVALLLPGFAVAGFIPALLGSFILSLVGWATQRLL